MHDLLERLLRAAAEPDPDRAEGLWGEYRDGGDEAAFATLLAWYGMAVYRRAWGFLRDHAAAEDAFQSAVGKLHANRARLATFADALRWWRGVVLNEARMALRARRRSRAREASAAKPEEAPEEGHLQAALREALDRLPDAEREAVALVYFEGLTRVDAAKVLDLHRDTLAKRLDAALGRLRQSLAGVGVLGTATTTATVEAALAAPLVAPSAARLAGLASEGAPRTGGFWLSEKTNLLAGTFLGGLVTVCLAFSPRSAEMSPKSPPKNPDRASAVIAKTVVPRPVFRPRLEGLEDRNLPNGTVVDLDVRQPWQDTGIDVVAGQTLDITANPAEMVTFGWSTVNADGVGPAQDGTTKGGTIDPDAVILSLLGKVGGTTAVGTGTLLTEGSPDKGAGFVGTSYHQVATASGRLYLGFNDDFFGDNSGLFHVSITVGPVAKTDQSITFAALAGRSYGDGDFALTASAGSGLPITFTAAGSATVYQSGGVWYAHITGAGNATITAHQVGDDDYNPAPDVARSFAIAKANPTVTAVGGSFVYDEHSHLATGSVTGVGGANLGTPTFTYSYQDADGNWVPTGNNGSDPPVDPGNYRAVGTFAGNANYNPGSAAAYITIAYDSRTLTDLSKAFNAGRTIPIKIQLTDANGNNVSASNITLTAVHLWRLNSDGTRTAVTLQDAGGSNPGNLFRYDAALGGYIFNLSTRGLGAGTYAFDWEAYGDPTVHELTFRLI